VDSNAGDDAPSLIVLESVRCLECGAVYSKPTGGGTVQENPGCPECGYVGWMTISEATFADVPLRRSAEGRPLRPSG
jgi:predicted  nucleic acid-binding Zn-ribbon protein